MTLLMYGEEGPRVVLQSQTLAQKWESGSARLGPVSLTIVKGMACNTISVLSNYSSHSYKNSKIWFEDKAVVAISTIFLISMLDNRKVKSEKYCQQAWCEHSSF